MYFSDNWMDVRTNNRHRVATKKSYFFFTTRNIFKLMIYFILKGKIIRLRIYCLNAKNMKKSRKRFLLKILMQTIINKGKVFNNYGRSVRPLVFV